MNETNNNAVTLESGLIREKYSIIKHKSGLTVYLFPKELKISYALFGAKYGSVQSKFRLKCEKEFTVVPDGIAHYLEHKLFESQDGESADAKYGRIGASANAFTDFLTTSYLVSCTDRFPEALKILLEMVTSPYFTEENVEKERGIIAQEIRMGNDDPHNEVIYEMLRALYENHNIRTDIAGTVESISKITPELLYKCYNTFYDLSNMGLCICGRFDEDEILSVIDSVLGDIKPTEREIENEYGKEKPVVNEKYRKKKMDVVKPIFSIGIKDVDISSDPEERMIKCARMEILCRMLFGKTGKLYNELYDKGLVSQSLNPWQEHNRSYSLISISGDSSDPEEVFEIFKNRMKAEVEDGLDKEDFERCRRVVYSDFIKSFDSTEDIAINLLLSFAFDGGEIFRYAEIIRDLTYEEVNETARKMLFEDAFALASVYPLDTKENS